MDRIIEVNVNGSYLTKDSNTAGVQHEANDKTLRITFDDGWDGYAKKVTFWDAFKQTPVKIILGADRLEDITVSTRVYLCPIPGEAMTEAGWCSFVIDGYVDGKRHRSVEDHLKVFPANFAEEAGEPADPTPTQAEQLQVQVEAILDTIQEAVASGGEAKEAAAEAAESAEAAKQSALKAGTPPYVGKNGNWFVWDLATGKFVDSGVSATGPAMKYDDLTEEQRAELMEPVEEDCKDYLSVELAKRGQLKPEFANSVAELEEKGDPTKLYVLPDGFIYAYMQSGESASNQIKRSIDTDGNLYNGGKGWKTGYRLNSSGTEAAFSGWEVTGFIPIDANSYAYFSGIDWNSDGQGKDYLALYDSSFNMIGSQAIVSSWLANNATSYVGSDAILDENNNLTYLKFSCLVEGGFAGSDKSLLQNMAYFRISACGITDESNIAVNELISESGSEYEWGSTGHAFVPADYEDRIFAAEQALDGHEARIQSLENGVDVGVPDYVVEEAENVISRVIAAQGGRTFTFAAITDLHYGNNGNQTGVERAVKAMKYIDKRIKLDAVAVLGDYTDGYPADGLDNAIGDFKAVSNVLDEMRFAPNLRLQGNHDYYANNFPTTHRFIQAYSDDVVWGSKLGGYFYRDFADFKLRVICVNTTEEGNDYVRCSAAQYGWFASALDLTDKGDVSQWQILVLSHHPLDWYVESDYVFCHILDAYKNGTSGTAGGVSFDYTGGLNAAKLIGNIHGHIHNLLTDYIHFGNVSGGNKSTVLRMSTPEACVGRENQYEGAWAEDTGYPKTANTAEETSFCVYCIDLDECTIKAICYGAGYDREVSYQYTNDVEPPEKSVLEELGLTAEEWTFELEDGTTVTKQVVVMV